MTDRKNIKKPEIAPKKARKAPPRTAWKKGESGNPAGKPPGTRNKMTLLAMAVMERDLEAITEKVITAALDGDLQAAKFVIERMVPPMRERPVSITLPDVTTLTGVSQAQAAILHAAGAGELLPAEATALAGIVEQRRKAIETQELEQRIAALEAQKK